jgi:hypothetical protein
MTNKGLVHAEAAALLGVDQGGALCLTQHTCISAYLCMWHHTMRANNALIFYTMYTAPAV